MDSPCGVVKGTFTVNVPVTAHDYTGAPTQPPGTVHIGLPTGTGRRSATNPQQAHGPTQHTTPPTPRSQPAHQYKRSHSAEPINILENIQKMQVTQETKPTATADAYVHAHAHTTARRQQQPQILARGALRKNGSLGEKLGSTVAIGRSQSIDVQGLNSERSRSLQVRHGHTTRANGSVLTLTDAMRMTAMNRVRNTPYVDYPYNATHPSPHTAAAHVARCACGRDLRSGSEYSWLQLSIIFCRTNPHTASVNNPHAVSVNSPSTHTDNHDTHTHTQEHTDRPGLQVDIHSTTHDYTNTNTTAQTNKPTHHPTGQTTQPAQRMAMAEDCAKCYVTLTRRLIAAELLHYTRARNDEFAWRNYKQREREMAEDHVDTTQTRLDTVVACPARLLGEIEDATTGLYPGAFSLTTLCLLKEFEVRFAIDAPLARLTKVDVVARLVISREADLGYFQALVLDYIMHQPLPTQSTPADFSQATSSNEYTHTHIQAHASVDTICAPLSDRRMFIQTVERVLNHLMHDLTKYKIHFGPDAPVGALQKVIAYVYFLFSDDEGDGATHAHTRPQAHTHTHTHAHVRARVREYAKEFSNRYPSVREILERCLRDGTQATFSRFVRQNIDEGPSMIQTNEPDFRSPQINKTSSLVRSATSPLKALSTRRTSIQMKTGMGTLTSKGSMKGRAGMGSKGGALSNATISEQTATYVKAHVLARVRGMTSLVLETLEEIEVEREVHAPQWPVVDLLGVTVPHYLGMIARELSQLFKDLTEVVVMDEMFDLFFSIKQLKGRCHALCNADDMFPMADWFGPVVFGWLDAFEVSSRQTVDTCLADDMLVHVRTPSAPRALRQSQTQPFAQALSQQITGHETTHAQAQHHTTAKQDAKKTNTVDMIPKDSTHLTVSTEHTAAPATAGAWHTHSVGEVFMHLLKSLAFLDRLNLEDDTKQPIVAIGAGTAHTTDTAQSPANTPGDSNASIQSGATASVLSGASRESTPSVKMGPNLRHIVHVKYAHILGKTVEYYQTKLLLQMSRIRDIAIHSVRTGGPTEGVKQLCCGLSNMQHLHTHLVDMCMALNMTPEQTQRAQDAVKKPIKPINSDPDAEKFVSILGQTFVSVDRGVATTSDLLRDTIAQCLVERVKTATRGMYSTKQERYALYAPQTLSPTLKKKKRGLWSRIQAVGMTTPPGSTNSLNKQGNSSNKNLSGIFTSSGSNTATGLSVLDVATDNITPVVNPTLIGARLCGDMAIVVRSLTSVVVASVNPKELSADIINGTWKEFVAGVTRLLLPPSGPDGDLPTNDVLLIIQLFLEPLKEVYAQSATGAGIQLVDQESCVYLERCLADYEGPSEALVHRYNMIMNEPLRENEDVTEYITKQETVQHIPDILALRHHDQVAEAFSAANNVKGAASGTMFF
ncbi:hypothetical protein SARC_09507 [Sphaeroforma arctica JP610]|uniref:Uncharacterized protein n=1 Tax=Sphaeroforma arctica JP610 TaxID=667725 RepID=A0A0L0FNJ5_9EUKA|nr:hypothetical protein SARC_09507 [Sphaeroforma arctica JP610]KNC78046.1 hypothetical protein SARC_09507 [Sphaeroforma arctica JP610]|eukprot:XP_014151948.1 hypothetical protein SARC_09507 [Sphaeroforma arctica JP610]